jgi:hypothetical protein
MNGSHPGIFLTKIRMRVTLIIDFPTPCHLLEDVSGKLFSADFSEIARMLGEISLRHTISDNTF